jgi:hypothetical protein
VYFFLYELITNHLENILSETPKTKRRAKMAKKRKKAAKKKAPAKKRKR